MWEKTFSVTRHCLETSVQGTCLSPTRTQASDCSFLNSNQVVIQGLKEVKNGLCALLMLCFLWACSVLTDATQTCKLLPCLSSNQQRQVHAAENKRQAALITALHKSVACGRTQWECQEDIALQQVLYLLCLIVLWLFHHIRHMGHKGLCVFQLHQISCLSKNVCFVCTVLTGREQNK